MAMIAWDFRRESACLEFHHATVHCTKMRFLISLSCTGVVWERCEWDPCGWDGIGQDHPVHLGDSTHGWDGGEGPFSNCCPPLYRSQLGGRIQKVHTNCKPLIISHHTKITYNVDCIHYCLPVHSWQKKHAVLGLSLTKCGLLIGWIKADSLLCRSQWSSIMGRFQSGKGWEGRCLFGSERGNRRSFNRW